MGITFLISSLPFSQNHRLSECARHLWKPSYPTHLSSRVSCPGPFGFWISPKDGDCTASLGYLCQCLLTNNFLIEHRKNCFLMFRDTSCVSVSAQRPLCCHWISLGRTTSSLLPLYLSTLLPLHVLLRHTGLQDTGDSQLKYFSKVFGHFFSS